MWWFEQEWLHTPQTHIFECLINRVWNSYTWLEGLGGVVFLREMYCSKCALKFLKPMTGLFLSISVFGLIFSSQLFLQHYFCIACDHVPLHDDHGLNLCKQPSIEVFFW